MGSRCQVQDGAVDAGITLPHPLGREKDLHEYYSTTLRGIWISPIDSVRPGEGLPAAIGRPQNSEIHSPQDVHVWDGSASVPDPLPPRTEGHERACSDGGARLRPAV